MDGQLFQIDVDPGHFQSVAGAFLWVMATLGHPFLTHYPIIFNLSVNLVYIRRAIALLQSYFEIMTSLLLDRNLRSSYRGEEVQAVATAHTHNTVRRLDGYHKGTILSFLKEAQLIDKNRPVISLQNANFQNTVLDSIDFQKTSLKGGDFRLATFNNVNLQEADLNNANLCGAIMTDSILIDTQLSNIIYDDFTVWPESHAHQMVRKTES